MPTTDRPSRRRDSVFDPAFREDLHHWVERDRRVALRILDLVEAVMRDPFAGIGKPERLKYLDADTWSRRITQEHRLVYHISDTRVTFLQARYHYERRHARSIGRIEGRIEAPRHQAGGPRQIEVVHQ